METLMTCILILISFRSTNALDKQNYTQKTYFEKINFDYTTRNIKIFNSKGEDVINGKLGKSFNGIESQECPTENQIPGHICLEWVQKARLYINSYELNGTGSCYNFKWTALEGINNHIDCFQFSEKEHWYGGGQNAESSLYLEKVSQEFSPFITGRISQHKWGNVLKRYFISSSGAALLVDNLSPLYTSLNEKKKEFCLKAKYDDFAFVNRVTDNVELNYTICTSSNSAQLHSKLISKNMWDGLNNHDFEKIDILINEPIWEIQPTSTDLTQESISNFTTDVIQQGFLKQGHILINEFWQKRVGDFTVDPKRFPILEDLIHILHRRGFKIVLSIQPFISTESVSFTEAVNKELLISERSCDNRIPALTRYKSLMSAGVLDPTKNNTRTWLLKKLKDLSQKYQIDGFYLDTGVGHDIPHYFQYSTDIINPDHYQNYFIRILNGVNLLGVSGSIRPPSPPTLVSLPHLESSWSGLRKIIPLTLSYGLLGYPLMMPGAIGGDLKVNNYTITSAEESLPDKELFIRWLQIASFMPIMKFSFLPNSYHDVRIVEIARNITLLRESKVLPVLKIYSRVALDTALPVIRPLWMIDGNDPTCYAVDDEFSVGDKIVVAPIIYPGKKSRNIYLPSGVWKDGIHGSYHKGGRWINDYNVEEHQIPFFENIPSIINI